MSVANLLSQNKYNVNCSALHCYGDLTVEGEVIQNGTTNIVPFEFPLTGALINQTLKGYFELNQVGVEKYIVMFITEDAIAGASAATTLNVAAGSVPILFRPVDWDNYVQIVVVDNSNVTFGMMRLKTDGGIVIYSGANGNFSNTTVGIKCGVHHYAI
jgi:hypothetical protein